MCSDASEEFVGGGGEKQGMSWVRIHDVSESYVTPYI